ncbi:MAG: FAD-binding domain-containing protein [Flavobacterium sp.]
MEFPTTVSSIEERIERIDPEAYARTRNYLSGAVSHLSPYLSRGMVSPRYVYGRLRQRHSAAACSRFLSELLWREYFQRLQQHNPAIEKNPRLGEGSGYRAVPAAIVRAATGITAIDAAIETLYSSGYMHNHARLYTAGVCIMAGYHYPQPARWMYYHLLDGDVASNYCSWQWAAGLHTGIRYVANQQNINRYCGTSQSGTFLDRSYEELKSVRELPGLGEQAELGFATILPATQEIPAGNRPILIYNSYNLDPAWNAGLDAERVLLLDPRHFQEHPVSEKVMAFLLGAARNISGIRIYRGSYAQLKRDHPSRAFIAKEHPLFDYPGARIEPREWLAEAVDGSYPSFTKYYATVLQKYHGEFA